MLQTVNISYNYITRRSPRQCHSVTVPQCHSVTVPQCHSVSSHFKLQERVADALGVNRNRATFRDSVKKRTEINERIKAKDAPLSIGDTVLCRHGQGTLIDYTPECKETGKADGCCCVQITHGNHSFDQKFPTSGKGKGGARLHRCERQQLMARVWLTIAQTGITNGKHHDSYATQHFMDMFIDKWCADHEIKSVHIHSDNAGSRFKNSRTLNYLSRLRDRLNRKVTWSFGCPGHGKGPWDGFGGLMKRVLRRDTIDNNIVISDFMVAAAHLRSRFCTKHWEKKHGLDSNYTINEVQIFTAHSKDIYRKSEEVYDSVQGIRKSFGYCALPKARVLQRWFDCWCSNCRASLAPGEGSMDSNYKVVGCERIEPWLEHTVELQGSRGIGQAKATAQKRGRELASKLKPNTYVAVQDREAQGYTVPFLIGITQDTGNGSCIVEEVKGDKSIDGTRFNKGDYAISVKW